MGRDSKRSDMEVEECTSDELKLFRAPGELDASNASSNTPVSIFAVGEGAGSATPASEQYPFQSTSFTNRGASSTLNESQDSYEGGVGYGDNSEYAAGSGRMWKCPECDRPPYEVKWKLNRHMKDAHEGAGEYKCVCGKMFNRIKALQRHQLKTCKRLREQFH